MVDHLPVVVWLPTAVLACTVWAIQCRRDLIARRRATRHQS